MPPDALRRSGTGLGEFLSAVDAQGKEHERDHLRKFLIVRLK